MGFAEQKQETMEHLHQLRLQQAEFHGPCKSCVWGNWTNYSCGKKCRNPIFARGHLDVNDGRVKWDYPYQKDTRYMGKLCGPNGNLYEPIWLPRYVWRWMKKEFWPVFILGGVIAFGLLMLLDHVLKAYHG